MVHWEFAAVLICHSGMNPRDGLRNSMRLKVMGEAGIVQEWNTSCQRMEMQSKWSPAGRRVFGLMARQPSLKPDGRN
jgi:hypothetical protein